MEASPGEDVNSPGAEIGVPDQGVDGAGKAAPQALPAAPRGGPDWIVLLYLVGAAAVLVRIGAASLLLERIVRQGSPITDPKALAILDTVRNDMGIRRRIPLLLAEGLSGPALVGHFRPKLLLPPGVLGALGAEELRLVFLHEAAHLKRRDILGNYLAALVAAMHWFNPVMWLILPALRAERELACDELVLARTTSRALYGNTLLKLLEMASPRAAASAFGSLAPSAGIIETRSLFTRRIHMIASFHKRPAWLALPVGAALLATSACVLTAPPPPVRAAAPESAPLSPGAPPPTARPETSAAYTITGKPEVVLGMGDGPSVTARSITIAMPATAGLSGEQPANAEALKKLAEPLKTLKLDKQPLEGVMDYLRNASGCNIVVNWRALEAAGIDRNTPISAELNNVPLRKVLRTILDAAGSLAYTVDDGVITISTSEDLEESAARWKLSEQSMATAYSVKQQLSQLGSQKEALAKAEAEYQRLAQANGRPEEMAAATKRIEEMEHQLATRVQQMQVVKAHLAAVSPSMNAPSANSENQTHAYDATDLIGLPANQKVLDADQRAAIQELAKTIAETVLGPTETIAVFNGTLVISAPSETHNKVADLLQELSQVRAAAVERERRHSAGQ
jgi:hypothetical protein